MLPEKVTLVEVGPRDGFQNIKEFISTDVKLSVIDGLVKSGFKRIQVTSFVSPKAIPQMQDAKAVAAEVLAKYPEVDFSALVPNAFGARSAKEAGIKEISFVISASERHNMENVRRTVAESFEELKKIREEMKEMVIKLDIATAFGCPFLGKTPVENVLKMIETGLEIGVDRIFICDTIGVANPKQVEVVIKAIRAKYPELDFGLHLHDTRGMGVANVLTALQNGVTLFESAAGGLGGCPFAPGAAGNIASEDLVNMFNEMGIESGVNLDTLLDTVDIVKKEIKKDLTGHMSNICRA